MFVFWEQDRQGTSDVILRRSIVTTLAV